MTGVLTLNIGAAARPRAEAILEWLSHREEDVFILTETSAGDGTAFLLERFRAAGYSVVTNTNFAGERGVALVSRIEIETDITHAFGDISIPVRIAGAVLKTEPSITVIGIYVPSRDASPDKIQRKRAFTDGVLEKLRRLSHVSIATTIVGGDYNVIAREHRPLHSGFLDFEFDFLQSLEALGLSDAQVRISAAQQVYSWVGRTGDGYKYDYFHIGPDLASRLLKVSYLEETRLGRRITDHSAVSVAFAGVQAATLSVDVPSVSDIQTLF